MRRIFFMTLNFVALLTVNAQESKKDTLFFEYDKNYTLFQDDHQQSLDVSYGEFERRILKNMHKTKTNGYFYFKKTDTLYNLVPRAILSLKDYVEKREFYYPGKYNRIINRDALRDKIFNKYKVFIVDNNRFIAISQRGHENFYNSYYPISYQDKEKYPKQLKDTLFFKYDKRYINTYQQIPNHFYLKDSNGIGHGSFFLEELQLINNIKQNTEALCLKRYVRTSKFYNKKKKRKLDDDGLFDYFDNFIIFLVKNKKEYIQVRANWEIE